MKQVDRLYVVANREGGLAKRQRTRMWRSELTKLMREIVKVTYNHFFLHLPCLSCIHSTFCSTQTAMPHSMIDSIHRLISIDSYDPPFLARHRRTSKTRSFSPVTGGFRSTTLQKGSFRIFVKEVMSITPHARPDPPFSLNGHHGRQRRRDTVNSSARHHLLSLPFTCQPFVREGEQLIATTTTTTISKPLLALLDCRSRLPPRHYPTSHRDILDHRLCCRSMSGRPDPITTTTQHEHRLW